MTQLRTSKKTRTSSSAKPAPRVLSTTQVAMAVQRMRAPSGGDRFAAGKELCLTAEKDPSRIYPHFDNIADLLASKSKVVTWNTMRLIALMSTVDTDRKIDALLDQYLAFVRGDNLISAANVINGAGEIARARPDLLDKIIPAILGVSRANYKTPECRNVAIGHALDTFAAIGPAACRRPDVTQFIKRQRKNPRAAVAKRAAEMVGELSVLG